jgi:hypothetical protein
LVEVASRALLDAALRKPAPLTTPSVNVGVQAPAPKQHNGDLEI